MKLASVKLVSTKLTSISLVSLLHVNFLRGRCGISPLHTRRKDHMSHCQPAVFCCVWNAWELNKRSRDRATSFHPTKLIQIKQQNATRSQRVMHNFSVPAVVPAIACQAASLTTLRAELCCCNLRGAAMDAEPARCRHQSCEMIGSWDPEQGNSECCPKTITHSDIHGVVLTIGFTANVGISCSMFLREAFPSGCTCYDQYTYRLSIRVIFTLFYSLGVFWSFHRTITIQSPPPPLVRVVRLVCLAEAERISTDKEDGRSETPIFPLKGIGLPVISCTHWQRSVWILVVKLLSDDDTFTT